ncbi:MAG: copper chaperone PCu(A)C [Ilumatobacter sp.]|nr:copper chaperone PCu(A)C [Ilumatobacter sp.]
MKRELTLLAAAALVLAACGGDDAAIETDNVWARESPAGVTAGAAYFDITANDDDVLIGASVSSDVAGDAQIHEVVPAESMDMGDDMGDDESMDESMEDGEHEMDMGDGEMAMVMQEMTGGLPLPAGETVSLAPGGYHVMLLDLVEPLEIGDEFDLTLDFENADDVTLTVTVAETAPGS